MRYLLAFIFVLLSTGFATAPGYAGEVISCDSFETCPDGTEWYCASPGSGGSCVTLCQADEYVLSNTCEACPAGTTNVAGDDASGSDTQCDVDYCSADQNGSGNACASDANTYCSNRVGGFDCICKPGYSRDGNGECTDINECEMGTDTCGADEICNNADGSFICSVSTQKATITQIYTVFDEGMNYTDVVLDEGNRVLFAAYKSGQNAQVVQTTLGPAQPVLEFWSVLASKGLAREGCLGKALGNKHAFFPMTANGNVTRLNFGVDAAVTYMLSGAPVWGDSPPQQLRSSLCLGPDVFFGSSTPTTSSRLVVRLNMLDDSSLTRFSSLDVGAEGNLVHVEHWGDDHVILVMEPNPDVPGSELTFFVVRSSDFSLVQAIPLPAGSLTGFETVTAMFSDGVTKRVVLANSQSPARVAILALDSTQAVVEQVLTLDTGSLAGNSITSFAVDINSRRAYATVGSCSLGDQAATNMVEIQLVPVLTQTGLVYAESGVHGCADAGTPVDSLVYGPSETDREIIVVTSDATRIGGGGAVLHYAAYPSTACPNDCYESDGQGECTGGMCSCYPEWTGSDCSERVPALISVLTSTLTSTPASCSTLPLESCL